MPRGLSSRTAGDCPSAIRVGDEKRTGDRPVRFCIGCVERAGTRSLVDQLPTRGSSGLPVRPGLEATEMRRGAPVAHPAKHRAISIRPTRKGAEAQRAVRALGPRAPGERGQGGQPRTSHRTTGSLKSCCGPRGGKSGGRKPSRVPNGGSRPVHSRFESSGPGPTSRTFGWRGNIRKWKGGPAPGGQRGAPMGYPRGSRRQTAG